MADAKPLDENDGLGLVPPFASTENRNRMKAVEFARERKSCELGLATKSGKGGLPVAVTYCGPLHPPCCP